MWKIGADKLIPSLAVDQVGERLAGEKACKVREPARLRGGMS